MSDSEHKLPQILWQWFWLLMLASPVILFLGLVFWVCGGFWLAGDR